MGKKNGKKNGKKGKKKWKSKYRRNNSIMIRGPSAIPDETYVKLRWQGAYEMASSAGILAYDVFRGNSPYDPDFSAGAGQASAMGFNEWRTFYQKYQVMGSKCTVRLLPNQNNGSNANCVLAVTDQSTSLTGIAQLQEQPYTKRGVLPLTVTSANPLTMSTYIDTKAKFGYNKIRQVEELSSDVTTNPKEQFFYVVAAATLDGSQRQIAIAYNIEIVYYVRFFDRKDLQRSFNDALSVPLDPNPEPDESKTELPP